MTEWDAVNDHRRLPFWHGRDLRPWITVVALLASVVSGAMVADAPIVPIGAACIGIAVLVGRRLPALAFGIATVLIMFDKYIYIHGLHLGLSEVLDPVMAIGALSRRDVRWRVTRLLREWPGRLWVCTYVLFAIDILIGLRGVGTLRMCILWVVGASAGVLGIGLATSAHQMKAFSRPWVVATILSLLVSAQQITTRDANTRIAVWFRGSDSLQGLVGSGLNALRIHGAMGSATEFSTILVVATAIAAAGVVTAGANRWPWMWLLALSVANVLTGTRSAWIAEAAVLATVFTVSQGLHGLRALSACASLLCIGAFVGPLRAYVVRRSVLAGSVGAFHSVALRLHIFSTVLRDIVAHPLGVGIGYPLLNSATTSVFGDTENVYLSIALLGGIVLALLALSATMAACGTLYDRARATVSTNSSGRTAALIGLATMAGLFVRGMVDPTWMASPQENATMQLIVGYSLAASMWCWLPSA